MRCPVCRADNSETAQCRRCRADLSLLITLEAGRRAALSHAAEAAARGDGETALRRAAEAHALRRDRDSWRALAVAHLLRRDFVAALHAHRAATVQ